MSETELKILLDAAATRRLRSRLRNSNLVDGATTKTRLRSIYFDTHDQALRKSGISLRLRREGRRWVQTVKTEGVTHGGLQRRKEVEIELPGGDISVDGIPDIPTRDKVISILNGGTLAPVCETVMQRTAAFLRLTDGARAELAIDIGEIQAGERHAKLREAEIELVEGDPGALFELARELFPSGGLRFSKLSKSSRGFLLAEQGCLELPLEPRVAQPVALDGSENGEDAAKEILRECFAQIADNVVTIGFSDDPEGPHQLRIGLRRLRSAFSSLGEVLASPEHTRLGAEARWLGREVGRLRDLDVVQTEIVQPELLRQPQDPGLQCLSEAVERKRAEARVSLKHLLAGKRAQTFLIDLGRFVEVRGWFVASDRSQPKRLFQPIPKVAVQVLDKRWKKARRRARCIEDLSVPERHELRKELKRFRYSVEFFAPLFSKKQTKKFLKRLKELQIVFGDLNDAAMLEAMFQSADSPAATDPGAQLAAGRMIGIRTVRAEMAWANAKTLWRELRTTPRFWR